MLDFNLKTLLHTPNFELIPNNTISLVNLFIKQGFYVCKEDPSGYATLSKSGTGAVYLNCEYVIASGPFKNRKIYGNIGLFSPKSDLYGDIGRQTIKAILESAHNIMPHDNSMEAQKKRIINSFFDLNNLMFVAKITVDNKGLEPRNEIKTIITPDKPEYKLFQEISVKQNSETEKNKFKIDYNTRESMNEKRPGVSAEDFDDEIPF